MYQFLDFEVDARASTLQKGGKPIAINPQAFAVLAYLIEHRDRMVQREELLSAVWNGVSVNDGSLTQAVWEIRRALQQDPRRRPSIRTVRGFGYQFVEEVRLVTAAPARNRESCRELVGRAEPLERLREAVRGAADGAGRCVIVSGPPGIGKTHLCYYLAAEAQRAGWLVLAGHASQSADAPPFWPWLQMLGRHLEQADGAAIARCRELAPIAFELVPRQGVRGLRMPRGKTPQEERAYLLEDLTRLFVTLAKDRRVLLLLEDFHWADEAALSLLRSLARVLSSHAILLLGTCRHATQPLFTQVVREVARGHLNECLELSGFTSEDIARLLEIPESDGGSLAQQVTHLTAGNPLFALEVARVLRVHERRTGARVARLEELHELDDVLRLRLTHLTREALAALQAAAVLGLQFRAAEAMLLLGESAQATFAAIEELERAAFLQALPQAGCFMFSHPIMLEVAYASLSRFARMELHEKAARVIERSGPDSVELRLTELSQHFHRAAEAGCAREACSYAQRAAERAHAQTAFLDAVQHYRRALHAFDLMEVREPAERVRILVGLGESLAASLAPKREVREVFREAFERARTLALPEWMARAALGYAGQHPLRFRPLRAHGTMDEREIAQLEEAQGICDECPLELQALVRAALAFALLPTRQRVRRDALLLGALALARQDGSEWLRARVLLVYVHTANAPDQLDALRRAADELVSLSDRLSSRELVIDARAVRAMCLLQTAELGAARLDFAIAARNAELLDDPRAKLRASALDVLSALWEGRVDDAEALSARALVSVADDEEERLVFTLRMAQVVSARAGIDEHSIAPLRALVALFPDAEGWRAALSAATATVGLYEEARREFDLAARDDFAGRPQDHSLLPVLQLLGEAAVELRDRERAALAYAWLEPYADRVIFSGWSACCSGTAALTLGRLAWVLGELEKAAAFFERARVLHEKLGATLFNAATDLCQARLLFASKHAADRRQAQSLLARGLKFAQTRKIRWLIAEADRIRSECVGPQFEDTLTILR